MFLEPHFSCPTERVSSGEPVDFTITHAKTKERIPVMQPGPTGPGSTKGEANVEKGASGL